MQLREAYGSWTTLKRYYDQIVLLHDALPQPSQISFEHQDDVFALKSALISYETVGGGSNSVTAESWEMVNALEALIRGGVVSETTEEVEDVVEIETIDINFEPLDADPVAVEKEFEAKEKAALNEELDRIEQTLGEQLSAIDEQDDHLEGHEERIQEAQTALAGRIDPNDDSSFSELLDLSLFAGIKTISAWSAHSQKFTSKIELCGEEILNRMEVKVSVRHYQAILLPSASEFEPLSQWFAQSKQALSKGMLSEADYEKVATQLSERKSRVSIIRNALSAQDLPMNLAFNIELDKFNVHLNAIEGLIHFNKNLKEQYEDRMTESANTLLGRMQSLISSARTVAVSLSSTVEGEYESYVENVSEFKASLEGALTPELDALNNELSVGLRSFASNYDKSALLSVVNASSGRFSSSDLITKINEAPYSTQIQIKDSILGLLAEVQSLAS